MTTSVKNILVCLGLSLVFGCQSSSTESGAASGFQLEKGMVLECIAKEPLVIDPVAFDFDEQGFMYVVEHRGYPDPAEGGSPDTRLGRVARLQDTNGDGVYDVRTEFASDFTYPNGILAWDGGVFVTCAPDIFYLKDVDNDGVADKRKVILTGFYDTKTAQIRTSHPTLGMDGWIYVTGGLNGGNITSPDFPDREAVQYSNGDGRFNPSTYEFEITGGKSQFGLCMDGFGRRFGCSNRHPVQHIVMEPEVINRNPFLPFSETINNVSKAEAEAVVYPISGAEITADFIPSLIGRSHTGTFTAASGVLVFNDESLSEDHRGNVFICESAQNLVQRQKMVSDGVSFSSAIAEDGQEFLASDDDWFRPVFLSHGPLGGLYIADMYRKVIDHPSYVPEANRADLDYESGRDMGRIYRVYPENDLKKDRDWVNSNTLSKDLIPWLESRNEWDRSTAFRVLFERMDKSVISLLGKMVSSSELPESRVKALCLIELLGGMDQATLQFALADQSAGVREQAVILSGYHPEYGDDSYMESLTVLQFDQSMRVRFQTAILLGRLRGKDALSALANIALRDGADKWSRAAVLSGIQDRMPEFLRTFQSLKSDNHTDAYALVMEDLGRVFGAGASMNAGGNLLREVFNQDDDLFWRMSTALGLVQGVTARDPKPEDPWKILLGQESRMDDVGNFARFRNEVMTAARDSSESTALRLKAVALLGLIKEGESLNALQTLVGSLESPDLQLEAVRSLAAQNSREAAVILMTDTLWTTYTPQVRSAVIAAMVSDDQYIDVLYEAIDDGVVTPTDIPSPNRKRLMDHKNSLISSRGKELFAELEEGSRMQIYEDYVKAFDASGDQDNGKIVFTRVCSSCHSYDRQGGNVGPDLTGVKNQPADALLLHTIVPNYEVYPSFMTMMVETKSGETLAGWLQDESEHSMTIRTASGTEESILRANIATLTNTGRSLMPEGLEQMMTKEEMNDLIAYLKSGG